MIKKIYLGDAVYAEYDGLNIILSTTTYKQPTLNQGETSKIILAPQVLEALDIYRNSIINNNEVNE